MKVALYCRVSTEEQTTENQRLILEEHAEKQGWDYETFVETESSRKTRPVKEKLLKELRAKKYDAFCVLKLDRWARSISELILEIKELFDSGVLFISLRDGIDLSTPTGKLQFHILAAFADFERELIRQRTLDGLARARKQGKTLGRPKGRKDQKVRRKSGYHQRWSKVRER